MLVPPGKPDALVRAIQDLSHDRLQRTEFACRGLERAGARTIERTAARTAAFLLNSHSPA
jgi:hypothetical protein